MGLPDPVRSDMSQWGPREWADVALYGTCQQCGWPRTVRAVIAPPGGFHAGQSIRADMVCGRDASHAA